MHICPHLTTWNWKKESQLKTDSVLLTRNYNKNKPIVHNPPAPFLSCTFLFCFCISEGLKVSLSDLFEQGLGLGKFNFTNYSSCQAFICVLAAGLWTHTLVLRAKWGPFGRSSLQCLSFEIGLMAPILPVVLDPLETSSGCSLFLQQKCKAWAGLLHLQILGSAKAACWEFVCWLTTEDDSICLLSPPHPSHILAWFNCRDDAIIKQNDTRKRSELNASLTFSSNNRNKSSTQQVTRLVALQPADASSHHHHHGSSLARVLP